MRYFLALTLSIAALALGIGKMPTAACAIFRRRSAKGLGAGLIGTRSTTVKLSSVAVTTDDHLAMAAGAVIETSTRSHQQKCR